MKNISALLIALLLSGSALITLLPSCTLSESGMKRSIGSANELLIVTNDKGQWEGQLGDTLRAFFAGEQVGLGQPEPIFDLVNVADENFNELFKKYHNILIVNIDPEAASTVSETKENLWGEPQRVIKLSANDFQSFLKEFNLKKETYLQMFIAVERERTLSINKASVDMGLSREVESKFGIFLPIPGGFYKATEAKDFMWLRHTIIKVKQDVELSIMIYSMDYQDTIVFNPKHIIQWRNTMTLQYVPGPSP